MTTEPRASLVEVEQVDVNFANHIIAGFRQMVKTEWFADATERHWLAKDIARHRLEALRRDQEPIVPPPNGEPDPEWAAIKRAIDQFAGRVPTVSKHRAVHNAHLAAVVERLDEAGDREAADTIVWQAWYRALDRERERFLLDDANARLEALRTQGDGEGRLADAEALLKMLVACDEEHPLLDQTDNDGEPYQSAQMAGLITHARIWLKPNDIADRMAAYRASVAAPVDPE